MDDIVSQVNASLACHDYIKALTLSLQIVHTDPENARGYYGCAICYNRLSRFEDARINIERAIQLDPSLSGPYCELCYQALKEKDNTKLLMYAEKAYHLAHGSVQALHYLGLAHMMNGNFNRSVEILKEASQLDPGNVDVHNCLYLDHVQLQQWTLAQDEAKVMFRLHCSYTTVWYLVGSYLRLKLEQVRFLSIFVSFIASLLITTVVFGALVFRVLWLLIISLFLFLVLLWYGIKIVRNQKFRGIVYIVFSMVFIFLHILIASNI